jgi:hypothetical protein
MRNRRNASGAERKDIATEEIQRVTGAVKVRVAEVADMLSDLEQARALYREGRKDDAFDFLIFILELHFRQIDLRDGIAVFGDVVSQDGSTISPEGQDQLIRERLHRKGIGPRHPRPVRVVPESPTEPNT